MNTSREAPGTTTTRHFRNFATVPLWSAVMIVETFFLVVEKRSIRAQNFHDHGGGRVAGRTFLKCPAARVCLVGR